MTNIHAYLAQALRELESCKRSLLDLDSPYRERTPGIREHTEANQRVMRAQMKVDIVREIIEDWK